ncbi:hypothetical protein Tco_0573711 [Tanacetum coccineum]
MLPTLDMSFTGLDEFVNKPIIENCKAMTSEEEPKVEPKEEPKVEPKEEPKVEPKVVRKYVDAPIIEECVSDYEEENVSQPKIEKKTVVSQPKVEKKTVRPRNFMPPKLDLSFSGLLDEPIVSEPTVKKLVVETSEAKASADKPKVVRKTMVPHLLKIGY